MKYLKFLVAIFMIANLALISSCSDEDDPTSAKTNTELLTQHTWKYSTGSSDNPLGAILLALFEGSEYSFKADKTYTGVLLGVPLSGDWSFNTSETALTIDDDEYTITQLDESNLKISQTDGGFTSTLEYVKK
ncbi:MAG: hypothetical protein RIB47_00785 [Cyclobacteriaceae bacterium]